MRGKMFTQRNKILIINKNDTAMKSLLQNIKRTSSLFLVTLLIISCSESYLDRETYGDKDAIRQDQFDNLDNRLDGTMRGIYAKMYEYGGSHETFGKRSIDMYGDICAGDMALTAYNFGQFYSDESLQTNTDRAGYIWNLMYSMLHNTNDLIRSIRSNTVLMNRLAVATIDSVDTYSSEDIKVIHYLAQAYAMRAYAHQTLLTWFCPPTQDILHHPVYNYTWDNYPTFPIHTEENIDESVGYVSLRAAYNIIESDLKNSIRIFTLIDGKVARSSKITVDINVCRALLAWSYLNKADSKADPSSADYKDSYTEALKYAEQVINSGAYSIIPQNRVLHNGFNDINNDSWMWGQDVTSESTTNLATFFGQVDIHTYSYAWAGDTKAIDRQLYSEIPSWDIRRLWFRADTPDDVFALCPDGKYFSQKNEYSTKSEDVDREWLSDNVWLRIEAVYLMAAEAACRLGNNALAVQYLTAITDLRVNSSGLAAAADYATWKSALSADALLDAIKLNWRVELWGEGYAWQTFRRLSTFVVRGSNHAFRPGETIDKSSNPGSAIADDYFCLVIPPDEIQYNPNL